jgi:subtilisin-like proprotein convertase family protein
MKLRFAPHFFLFSLMSLAMASLVQAQTFSNTMSITINDDAAASPYPSNIMVTGLAPMITDVNVTLTNLNHQFPDDVGVLLVGPTGVAVRLMTDAGGGSNLTPVTMTFDDAAAVSVPDEGPIVTGTSYKPTAGSMNLFSDAHPADFAAPAPAGPYSLSLSSFNGTDPNGTWKLYVDDDTAIAAGTIDNGWSLTFTVAIPEPSTWMLLSIGLVGMVAFGWMRRRYARS